MTIKKLQLSLITTLILSTSLAMAGTMGVEAPPVRAFGEASFSAGYFGARVGKVQHINIVSLVGNRYTLDKKTTDNFLIGLGYLVHGREYSRFNLDYGIKAFYLADTHVRGTIVQEDLFTNLSYRYSVSHVPIYAMARATVNNASQNLALTLDAGIGPNVLTTHDYYENALDNYTLPDNAFHNHTQAEFSATAGVGVKFNNLFDSASIELGYRFFYLGQGNFRSANNQILNRLVTKDVYANAVVLTVAF
ncbi:MAG: hypothetical protein H0U70_10840 [Tatlockia sp.]|nr:hypothetical protein [Tatlockia sp.]